MPYRKSNPVPSTRVLVVALLVLGGLLLVAVPAEARGGRYAAPSARPPSATEPIDEPAPPPATATNPDQPERVPVQPPTVAPPAPTVPIPSGPNGTRPGGRRLAPTQAGIVDWIHWYEVRRDRFEDLRASFWQTDRNPVFAVGKSSGGSGRMPAVRVGDTTREEILRRVLAAMQPESGHWLHTEAAGYVALGRVASATDHVAGHLRVLSSAQAAPQYLQESAVLGLAQLGRDDTGRSLPANLLDRVRATLLRVLADDAYGARTRGFAAVALGLLADQPSLHAEGAAAWTAENVFRTWITTDMPQDTQAGVMLGLADLDPAAVPRVVKLVLEGCALKGRAWPKPVSTHVRAHTLIALAHLGGADSAKAIAKILTSDKESPVLRQAAAQTAGVLGRREVSTRKHLAEALLQTIRGRGEPGTRHLALISLGEILAAEVAREDHAVLEDLGAGKALLDLARRGRTSSRSFAALSLALVVREIGHTVDSGAWQGFRFDALERIRDGAQDTSLDTHARAAFCVALGIAEDRHSGELLLGYLDDTDLDPELRAYAALGLGLMGDARAGVLPALTRALADPRSELLQMRAATALGLLGGGGDAERDRALKILVLALKTTRSQAAKGQIAVTLGRIGDARVTDALVAMLEGEGESHLNRAIACAALGLIGDEGIRPALSETRERAHYLAGSSVVFELLDLL